MEEEKIILSEAERKASFFSWHTLKKNMMAIV